MSKAAARLPDNVLQLRRSGRTPAQERAARTAGQVRHQLSLLQGYADLMEGLSPEQNAQILRIMAEKIRELTVSLHPFLEQAGAEWPPSRTTGRCGCGLAGYSPITASCWIVFTALSTMCASEPPRQ